MYQAILAYLVYQAILACLVYQANLVSRNGRHPPVIQVKMSALHVATSQFYHQCWAPQIYTQFCTENPQVCDRFAVTFCTSATANAHCFSANLDRNVYCCFVFVTMFFSNFAVGQTLTSKKKGHQHPDVNLQPRKYERLLPSGFSTELATLPINLR